MKKKTKNGYKYGDTVMISKPSRYSPQEASRSLASAAMGMFADHLYGIRTPASIEQFKALKSKKKQQAFVVDLIKDLADLRDKFHKENTERCSLHRKVEILEGQVASRNAAIKALSEVL